MARPKKPAPLDPDKDFGTPVKRVAELVPEADHRQVSVIDGFMLCKFLKPHHDLEKSGRRNIGMEFSFALSDQHNGYIPEKVKSAWEWIIETGNKGVQISGVPMQRIGVTFAPDMKPEIELTFASISNASVTSVEETGEGNAEEVVRFSFRAWAEMTKDLLSFAGWNHGKDLWVKMESVQGKLALGKEKHEPVSNKPNSRRASHPSNGATDSGDSQASQGQGEGQEGRGETQQAKAPTAEDF